jgi:hypothetical protein
MSYCMHSHVSIYDIQHYIILTDEHEFHENSAQEGHFFPCGCK